jgi:hypothetical protein
MAVRDKNTLRYWAKTEQGIIWFMNGVEFLNWTKGRDSFEGGCRPMTIEEWKSFAASNPIYSTAHKVLANS